MKTIFYAHGPQLKENFILPSTMIFDIVDIFPLMCYILHMNRCPPSNGSLTTVQTFLIDSIRSMNMTEKETDKLQDGPMGLVIYLLGRQMKCLTLTFDIYHASL
jgi:hypothetical protein